MNIVIMHEHFIPEFTAVTFISYERIIRNVWTFHGPTKVNVAHNIVLYVGSHRSSESHDAIFPLHRPFPLCTTKYLIYFQAHCISYC